MSTIEEVDKFYQENYYKLINYITNRKKGGDKTAVISDDAIDILHDTYCYHKANPETFSPQFVWNVLQQRRIDYLRKKDNYNSLKDDFFKNYYTGGVKNLDGLDETVGATQLKALIKEEISSINNVKHKTILTRHILLGEKIPIAKRSDVNVVTRFKKKMIEKYGGENEY